MEDKTKNCACMDCEIHCECELHKDYEENHCNNGQHPIDICTIKDKNNN